MSCSAIIAKKISAIMNPFPLTLVVLVVVSYAGATSLEVFAGWATVILVSFVVVPFAYVYVRNALVRHKVNLLQDPTAFFRAHRSNIWVIGVISAALFIPPLIFLDAPSLLFATFAALLGTSIFIALINKYYKASFHVGAITALAIVAVLVWGKAVLPVLVVIPLIGWARYALHQHSAYQLACGFTLALIMTTASFYYFGLLERIVA